MAKKKEEVKRFKSRFGSHADMVVESRPDGTVVCEDEYGQYETHISNIDNSLADRNRFDLNARGIDLQHHRRKKK